MDETLRQPVTLDEAKVALAAVWPRSVRSISALASGAVSAAFSFASGDGEYILRLGRRPENYVKDRIMGERFAGSSVPVPQVLVIAEHGTFTACISERLPGPLFCDLTVPHQRRVASNLLDMLIAIHDTDITRSSGYGHWGADGNARFESAQGEIAHNLDEFRAIADGLGDSKMIHALAIARELAPYAPEERRLLHCDFGFNNAVASDDSVTGVFDWGSSAYGDRVKDLAWLMFWQTDIDFAAQYRAKLRARGEELPNFEERLRLHLYLEVAGSIHFFHDTANSSGRDMVYRRLEQLDAETPERTLI